MNRFEIQALKLELMPLTEIKGGEGRASRQTGGRTAYASCIGLSLSFRACSDRMSFFFFPLALALGFLTGRAWSLGARIHRGLGWFSDEPVSRSILSDLVSLERATSSPSVARVNFEIHLRSVGRRLLWANGIEVGEVLIAEFYASFYRLSRSLWDRKRARRLLFVFLFVFFTASVAKKSEVSGSYSVWVNSPGNKLLPWVLSPSLAVPKCLNLSITESLERRESL